MYTWDNCERVYGHMVVWWIHYLIEIVSAPDGGDSAGNVCSDTNENTQKFLIT